MEKRRADIDAIRGASVIAVLAFHLNESIFSRGYLGVDAFFTISGYVITRSSLKYIEESSANFLPAFWKRRLFRIMPALTVCMIFSFICLGLFVPFSPTKSYLESILTGVAALLGASNILLFKQAADYFGDWTNYNFFMQTWSLGVEEQFYALFPIAFLCYSRITRKGHQSHLLIFGLIFTLATISFWMYAISCNSGKVSEFGFYLLPSRAWQLLIGVIAALYESEFRNFISNRFSTILSLGFIYGAAFGPQPISSLSASMLTASVMIFRLLPDGKITNTLAFLGLRSYSIYLYHWPIICLLRWTIGITPASSFVAVLTTFAAGYTSHKYIEQGFGLNQSGQRSFHPKMQIASLYISSVSCGIILLLSGPAFSIYTGDRKAQRDVDELAWKYRIKSIKDAHSIRIARSKAKTRVFLYGNSYARHLLPALQEIQLGHKIELYYTEIQTDTFEDQHNSYQIFKSEVAEASNGDTFIISSHFASQISADELARLPTTYQDIAKTWSNFWDSLEQIAEARGVRIIYVTRTPEFPKFPYFLVCEKEWFRPTPPNCIRTTPKSKLDNFSDSYLINHFSNSKTISVIDLLASLCGSLYCENHMQGKLLYRDSSHLNNYGSKTLREALESHIRPSL